MTDKKTPLHTMEGIGVIVDAGSPDGIYIHQVGTNTPAAACGLETGDRLTGVVEPSGEWQKLDSQDQIPQGPKGTHVTFSVVKPNGDRHDITLSREIITAIPVSDSFSYLFGENTPQPCGLISALSKPRHIG